MQTTKDPPIRSDERCAQCGGRRLARLPKVITQRSRAELLDNLAKDPFCSAVCARAYYGIDLKEQHTKAHDEDHEWAVG